MTRKVLDSLGNRIGTELLSLEAKHDAACDRRVELRAFAEGGPVAGPARLGRDIDLVTVVFTDPGCTPFGTRDLREILDELWIIGRRHAERAWPYGEQPGAAARLEHRVTTAEIVERIGVDDQRNAKSRPFCHLLPIIQR